jgi:hypothetical protein
MQRKPLDVLICFDTTASMNEAIVAVRKCVTEFVPWLHTLNPCLRIALISHGDYCDGPRMMSVTDFTADAAPIIEAVRTAPRTHGGDLPECYEAVYSRARSLSWRSDADKLMFQFSDATPHALSEIPRPYPALDWKVELSGLAALGVKAYAVQCLESVSRRSPACRAYYEEIAARTGGMRFSLENWPDVPGTIGLCVTHSQGPEVHAQYVSDLQERGQYSGGLAAVSMSLNTGARSRGGLKGVEAGRFRVMQIPAGVTYTTPAGAHKPGCKIEEFVAAQRLEFEPGDGYYQWTKPERSIGKEKQVIVESLATHEFFEGDKARKLAGLPAGADASRAAPPSHGAYRYYIQSTSFNRVLLPGTYFLYKARAA